MCLKRNARAMCNVLNENAAIFNLYLNVYVCNSVCIYLSCVVCLNECVCMFWLLYWFLSFVLCCQTIRNIQYLLFNVDSLPIFVVCD